MPLEKGTRPKRETDLMKQRIQRHRELLNALLFLATAILCGSFAGAQCRAMFAAAAGAASACWLVRLYPPRRKETGFVTLDPDDPDVNQLAEAFRQSIRRTRQQHRPLLLRIQPIASAAYLRFTLDLNRKHDIELRREGKRPIPLNLRGEWIADHPLPLSFPTDHIVTMRFTPTVSERIRVAVDPPSEFPLAFWFGALILTLLCTILELPMAAAALSAFAIQSFISDRLRQRRKAV